MEIAGSAILLTGASTGIGAATARALAAQGARLGLVARRQQLLDEVAADCRAAGSPEVAVWAADLSDLELAERVALEADDRFGGVDVLVNNAGAPMRRHATRLTADAVEEITRLNYFSPVRMTLALLPRMLERGRGTIVNVASLAGRVGPPREAAYAGSKFALNGFSEGLAVDLWDTPVEVRVVQPGPIETPIWGDVPGNEPPIYSGQMFPPEDCATAIVEAITGTGFEHYVPADLKGIVELKSADVDGFLQGNAAFARDSGSVSEAREGTPEWVR